MADINNKSIDELQSASAIADADLLVLQQNGVAKSVSGSVVKNFVGQKVVEELPNAVSSLGYDYVVDQGTSGNWSYRKWNSGKCELWGTHTFQTESSTAHGSLYYSDLISISLPFSVSNGVVSGTVTTSLIWISNTQASGSAVIFRALKAEPFATNATYGARLLVYGTWR